MIVTESNAANPFVGPRPFDKGEALFGRERESEELLDRLIAQRIMVLHSPSGAGKTSLIQAALIPALENTRFEVLYVRQVGAPGARVAEEYLRNTLSSLEEALPPGTRRPEKDWSAQKLTDYLKDRPRPAKAPPSRVLIFDHFEAILAENPTDRERAACDLFFGQMSEALHDPNLWALFSLREEYVAALMTQARRLPTQLRAAYRLELLGKEEAQKAICGPMHKAGVRFSEKAAGLLIDDLRRLHIPTPGHGAATELGSYVEPFLLQVVCELLWESPRRRPDEISADDVRRFGSVDGAVRTYYRKRVAQAAEKSGVPERTIRDWLGRDLIRDHVVRGQALLNDALARGLNEQAVDLLVAAHLVRKERHLEAVWLELAHSRLVEPIQTDNTDWRRRQLSEPQQRAQVWDEQGQLDELLLRGAELGKAKKWEKQNPNALSPVEKKFLDKSKSAARNRLVKRILWGVVGVLLVLSIYFGTTYLSERKEKRFLQQKARVIECQRLFGASLNVLDRDPELSLLLGLEAVARIEEIGEEKTELQRQAIPVLNQVLQSLRTLDKWPKFTDGVNGLAVSRDGRYLVAGCEDGTVKIRDLQSNALRSTSPKHEDAVVAVAISFDGQIVVSGGQDGLVCFWSLETGKQVGALPKQELPVKSVAYSPDGRNLATRTSTTRTNKKNVRLWNTKTHEILRDLDEIVAIAFSPDGKRFAAATNTKVLLVDLENDKLLEPQFLSNSAFGDITSIAFSSRPALFAVGHYDGTIELFLFVCFVLPTGLVRAQGEKAEEVTIKGKVTKIDTENKTLTVTVDDIPVVLKYTTKAKFMSKDVEVQPDDVKKNHKVEIKATKKGDTLTVTVLTLLVIHKDPPCP